MGGHGSRWRSLRVAPMDVLLGLRVCFFATRIFWLELNVGISSFFWHCCFFFYLYYFLYDGCGGGWRFFVGFFVKNTYESSGRKFRVLIMIDCCDMAFGVRTRRQGVSSRTFIVYTRCTGNIAIEPRTRAAIFLRYRLLDLTRPGTLGRFHRRP